MGDDWFTRERLHDASAGSDIEEVKRLLRAGYDVNAFDDIGRTPLHHAAENEQVIVMQLLIESGADVNAHEEQQIGETPLGKVASQCSLPVAQLLIDAGADPTIPGWMKITAIQRAAERTDPEGRAVYELLRAAAAKRRA